MVILEVWELVHLSLTMTFCCLCVKVYFTLLFLKYFTCNCQNLWPNQHRSYLFIFMSCPETPGMGSFPVQFGVI